MTRPEPTAEHIRVAEEFSYRLARKYREKYHPHTLEGTESQDRESARQAVAASVAAGTLMREVPDA